MPTGGLRVKPLSHKARKSLTCVSPFPTVDGMRTKQIAQVVIVIMSLITVTYSVWQSIHAPYTCEKVSHKVEYGDTISGIVRKYCRGNLQQADYEMVKKYGTLIHPTQRIVLGE